MANDDITKPVNEMTEDERAAMVDAATGSEQEQIDEPSSTTTTATPTRTMQKVQPPTPPRSIGAVEAAALAMQAESGQDIDTSGTASGWASNLFKALSYNAGGKAFDKRENFAQQILARGYERNSDGTITPIEKMSDEHIDFLVDKAGMNGVAGFFRSILPEKMVKDWRGEENLMKSWDDSIGIKIDDPFERRVSRAWYARDIATGMLQQKQDDQWKARKEINDGETGFGAELVKGLIEQGAYSAPYFAGLFGAAASGAYEGFDRYYDLRSDVANVDDKGNYNVEKQGDDFGTALAEATARGVMAPTIEMFGGKVLKGVKPLLGATVGKIPLFKQIGNQIVASSAGRAMNTWMRRMSLFGRMTGMHSAPEEVLEEFEDQVLDAAFGLNIRESEKEGTTALSRAGGAAADFFKPENLADLAKSMVLMQVLQSGVAHAADRNAAKRGEFNSLASVDVTGEDGKKYSVPERRFKGADGILEKVCGVDRSELKYYTAEEKQAAVQAWAEGLSEEDIVKIFKGGAKAVSELTSKMADAAKSYDFGAKGRAASGSNSARFTAPVRMDENGNQVPAFETITDEHGNETQRLTDANTGITIDAVRGEDGLSFKVSDRRGRVRSAETAEQARAVADEMATSAVGRDEKLRYIEWMQRNGTLRGQNVIVGDSMKDVKDKITERYGAEAWNRIIGSEDGDHYDARNPSFHFTVGGQSGVAIVLDNVRTVSDANDFAAHEAAIHSGLTALRNAGERSDFLNALSKSGMDPLDKLRFDEAVQLEADARGMTPDQVLKDPRASEEVFAYVMERFCNTPSAKNYVVSAMRKWYRKHFNRDLEYDGNELYLMAHNLRSRAEKMNGGALDYRSEQDAKEEEYQRRLHGRRIVSEKANEEQPAQLPFRAGVAIENAAEEAGKTKQLGYDPNGKPGDIVGDGFVILGQMQRKERSRPAPKKGDVPRETAFGVFSVPKGRVQMRPQTAPVTEQKNTEANNAERNNDKQSESADAESATRSDRTGVSELLDAWNSDNAEDNKKIVEKATDDEIAFIFDAYGAEMDGESGTFKDAVSDVVAAIDERDKTPEQKQKEAEDAEKARKESERKAKEEAESAEEGTAYKEWLKNQTGRNDSQAARDEFADLQKAVAATVTAVNRRHAKSERIRLRHAMKKATSVNGKRWMMPVGEGVNLESAMAKLNRIGMLYDKKSGEMTLIPFVSMVKNAIGHNAKVGDDAVNKVASILRDHFSALYNNHLVEVRAKTTEAWDAERRAKQKERIKNVVEVTPRNKAIGKYTKEHPESFLAAWTDYVGLMDDETIRNVFAGEKIYEKGGWDEKLSEFNNLYPGFLKQYADGSFDLTRAGDSLIREIGNAVANAESGTTEQNGEEAVMAGEEWRTDYAEKPSWWDKEPWEMTDAEEKESEAFSAKHPEYDYATVRGGEDAVSDVEMAEAVMDAEADLRWRKHFGVSERAWKQLGPYANALAEGANAKGGASVKWRKAYESGFPYLGNMEDHIAGLRTEKFYDGETEKRGAESEVRRVGDKVYKYRDASDFGNGDLEKIILHNEVFGEDTPYRVVGFVKDNWFKNAVRQRIVLEQPYVDAVPNSGEEARRKIVAALEERFGKENVTATGDFADDGDYRRKPFLVKAGPYTIGDLKDANVAVDAKDGKAKAWDCTIEKDAGADVKWRKATVTPEMDAAYMDAVKRGDMETARRMVREAAAKAGYETAGFHGTYAEFNRFRTRSKFSVTGLLPIFLSKDISTASSYGKRVISALVKIDNPAVVDCRSSDALSIKNDGVLTQDDVDAINSKWHNPDKKSVYDSFSTNQIAYAMRLRGNDGVVFNNVKDSYHGNSVSTVYAVFNGKNVKSADPVTYDDAGNVIPLSERFNDAKDDIRYRRAYTPDARLRAIADAYGITPKEAADLMNHSASVGVSQSRNLGAVEAELVNAAALGDPMASAGAIGKLLHGNGSAERWQHITDALRRRIQDYMLPVMRMEQFVGLRDMAKSVYHAADFAFGKTTNALRELNYNVLEPLKEEIAKKHLDEKSTDNPAISNLHELLLSLHGPAFNRMISERTDGRDLEGSGRSTQFWMRMLRKHGAIGTDAELTRDLENGTVRFAPGSFGEKAQTALSLVYAMNQQTRDTLNRSGRLSDAQKRVWETYSKYYVPMRFDMDADQNFMESYFYGSKDTGPIYTKAYSKGESKHAFGHDGMIADNPIAFSVQQAESAILRAADNDVRTRLAELVEANPNLGQVIDSTNAATNWRLPTVNVLGENGKSHSVPDVNGTEQKHGNIVAFKRNGDLHFIILGTEAKDASGNYLNEKNGGYLSMENAKLVGRAVKKQSLAQLGGGLRFMRGLTTAFGLLRTSFSLEFAVSNFLADGTQAARNLHATFGAGAYRQFFSVWLPSVKAAYKFLNHKQGNTQLDRYMQEFADAGGLIGGFATENFKDIERKIAKDVRRFSDNKMKAADFLMSLGEKLNGPIELATRLASYTVCRQNGYSEQQAASYGRDVTVNFNRKGEWTPVINALFAFSNASIQDIHRSGVAFAAKAGGRMAFGLTVAGFVASLLGYWQDDPEEEMEGNPQWKNTKEYVKQNKLGFRFGGTFLSSPIRGVSRIPYYLGHKAYEVIFGKTGAGEAAADATMFAIQNVGDPIGDASSPAKMLVPSIARPIVEDWKNESFTGSPIYREPMDRRQVLSDMGRGNTSTIAKAVARGLNWITGGNSVRRGMIDVQPERIAHYYQWLTGSAGADAARMVNLVTDIATLNTDNMSVRNIPFLRRFASGIDVNSARFHDAQDAFKTDLKEFNELAANDPSVARELADKHPYFKPGRSARRWREHLDDLQKTQSNLMKLEMGAQGEDRKTINELRMKTQAAFLYRIDHDPANDSKKMSDDTRNTNRIVNRMMQRKKIEQRREKVAEERKRNKIFR